MGHSEKSIKGYSRVIKAQKRWEGTYLRTFKIEESINSEDWSLSPCLLTPTPNIDQVLHESHPSIDSFRGISLIPKTGPVSLAAPSPGGANLSGDILGKLLVNTYVPHFVKQVTAINLPKSALAW